jgi:hypothetical protein
MHFPSSASAEGRVVPFIEACPDARKTTNQGEDILSKVIIAAFLATSAVALEAKPMCSGPDHDQSCAATRQALRATVRTLEIADTSASHGDVRTNDAVG